MAEFRAISEDFDEIIRRQRRAMLRRQGPYPLGALGAAVMLVVVSKSASLVAPGMSLAWGISTILEWRHISAAVLWQFAWAQEGVSLDVEEGGLRLRSQRGDAFIRWQTDVVVRALATCYVLEDEGEITAVIPKRYLSTTELLLFERKAVSGPTTRLMR